MWFRRPRNQTRHHHRTRPQDCPAPLLQRTATLLVYRSHLQERTPQKTPLSTASRAFKSYQLWCSMRLSSRTTACCNCLVRTHRCTVARGSCKMLRKWAAQSYPELVLDLMSIGCSLHMSASCLADRGLVTSPERRRHHRECAGLGLPTLSERLIHGCTPF